MKVTAIKTEVVKAFDKNITDILSASLKSVPENCVIAITSKIVSLCEGNAIASGSISKDKLIEKESDYFLAKDNKYDIYLTIKNKIMITNAGIDESNTGGYYVLWPDNPQESADYCWKFIREKYKVKNIGIIITDSIDTPLKWGVTGTCLSYCGFRGINDKINKTDLFDRKFQYTKINVANALAASAVLCMGETDEQTPIALLEDLPFVEFMENPPSEEEIKASYIDIKEDLYGQLLKAVKWQKGKK